MAFISPVHQGRTYEPGWFLESDVGVVRKTRELPQSLAEAIDGKKIVKMGTVYPSNDANAVGLVYEDVDVTWDKEPGSVVLAGRVYEDRLPVALAAAAKSAMEALGFKFIPTSPEVTRPY